MKILFQNRPDVYTNWGGDTTQMVETKKCLEKYGVNVEVSLDTEPELLDADIVHVFNIQQADYALRQLRNAKQNGIPVVVSTIYWDTRHISQRSKIGELAREVLSVIPYSILRYFPGYSLTSAAKRRLRYESARLMLQEADLLLPNSYAEAEILSLLFKAPWIRSKVHIVPNGIDVASIAEIDYTFADAFMMNLPVPYVLQVARIEPVKGQLSVIRALTEQPDIPLVFIGRGLETEYGQQCKKCGEHRGNTYFVGEVPHYKLGAYYKAAKVHVLPSLRESPGLVTLEAAAHGANCVVSFHGPVAEYFGQDVWYCDPLNLDSLKNALLKAWHAPNTGILKSKILACFTWEHAAQNTLEAYSTVKKK